MNVRADQLISPKELAELSGWSTSAIRTLISEKEIRHIKIGSRFLLPRNAVDEFVARKMVDPRD